METVAEKLSMYDIVMREVQIDKLAQEIFANSERSFTPMYPLVFVRILKKEQITPAGVIIQEAEQNKPMYEGVIVATWQPRMVEKSKVDENGNRFTKVITERSAFEPGDWVCFPHWTGTAAFGHNDKKYRLIKEREVNYSTDGALFGRIEAQAFEDAPLEIMRELLARHMQAGLPADQWLALLMTQIRDRFILLDKEQPSFTLSGR